MKGPVAIVLAFATGLIVTAVLGPPHDGDLWWQTWLGESVLRTHTIPTALGAETFSVPGAPWVAHEWLFSVLLAAASAHGLRWLFAVCVAASAVGAVAIGAARAVRAGASPLAAATASALAVIAMIPSLGLRVQVVAWLFVSAFVALALDAKRRPWCVPLAIVWANVHASVVLAPITMLVVVACEAVTRRAHPRDALVLLGTFVAPLVTPLGARLPEYAVALAQSPIGRYIVEWQTPFHSPFYIAAVLAASLVLTEATLTGAPGEGASGRPRRVPLVTRGIAWLYFALALSATRHVPVFFLVVAPMAAARFPAVRDARPGVSGRTAAVLDGVLAVCACAAGVVAALASARAHPPLPYAAIASVTTGARDVRLFCSDYSWCGMAVGRPGVRVFLDGRADPYPELLFAQTVAWTNHAHGTRGLRFAGVNTVLVATSAPLAQTLGRARDWTRTFDDGRYVVFRAAPLSRS